MFYYYKCIFLIIISCQYYCQYRNCTSNRVFSKSQQKKILSPPLIAFYTETSQCLHKIFLILSEHVLPLIIFLNFCRFGPESQFSQGEITGTNNMDVLFPSTSGVLSLILHVRLEESECHGYRAKRGSSAQDSCERREIQNLSTSRKGTSENGNTHTHIDLNLLHFLNILLFKVQYQLFSCTSTRHL